MTRRSKCWLFDHGRLAEPFDQARVLQFASREYEQEVKLYGQREGRVLAERDRHLLRTLADTHVCVSGSGSPETEDERNPAWADRRTCLNHKNS